MTAPDGMAELVIEAGFTAATPALSPGALILDDPTFGLLDTGTLADDTGWTSISAPITQAATVTRSSTREQGPVITYEGGTMSVTLDNSDARFTPQNLSGPYVTPGSPAIRVGANLNLGDLGAANYAAAVTAWTSLTGLSVPVTRIYKGASAFLYNFADVTAVAKVCLSLQPAYNPVSPADLASMEAMLQQMQADGADVEVALWHEPFFSGLTNTQYVNMIAFYGPTVRKYNRLWFVCSGSDTDPTAGYYPGDDAVDGVAVDAYAGPGSSGVANAEATVLQAMGIADSGGKPFAVWEFGAGFDLGIDPPPQAQSHAQVTSYFQWLTALFAERVADGKPCGDLLFFSSHGGSTGSYNFLGTGLTAGGGFEGGSGNWASGSGTFGTSSAQAHSGATSATITSTGAGTANILSSTSGSITTNGMPVTAGQIVGATGWFRSQVTARSCRVDIQFFDSGGVSLSTFAGGLVSDSTSAWVMATASTTAPASSAYCRLNANVTSIAGAGEVHYFDDPQLGIIPASNDLTAPVQYGSSVDYRVPLLQALSAALDGTGAIDAVTQVQPMVPVRARALWQGTSYDLFHGFAQAWVPGEDQGPDYEQVILNCADGFLVLQGVTIPASGAVGAGELPGARAQRILAAAGWYDDPRGMSNLSAGSSPLQATTFGDTALALLQLTAASEIGSLFVDGSGAVTLTGRHDVLTNPRSATVQAVFGDQPGTAHPAGTELYYSAAPRPTSDLSIANDVQATIAGGTTQEARDAASIRKYLFPRTYSKDGLLLQADSDALNWAQYVLYIASGDAAGFDSLTTIPAKDPANLWPVVLGLRIGDRVQVWRRPPGGVTITADCLIRGISHTITAGEWTTTFQLTPAARYSFLVLDDPIYGVLGSSALAFLRRRAWTPARTRLRR